MYNLFHNTYILGALGLPSNFLKWSQIWDVFLLLHLKDGLPSVLQFVLEVVIGTGTGIGEGLGSKLEGFASFGVGSSRLSI